MNCPYCGKEMKQGALTSRNAILWSETGETLSFFHLRTLPALTDVFRVNNPAAYRCEDCKTIILPYQ